ncbi:MAG: nitroreductase family protein [Bacteroidaceae bacterium]|nr:nitroreductase family protein [Bacteroidaceae bacterium]
MSFKELAQKRRSIRTFTEQPVTEEQRKQLMTVALMAPTGKNCRAWEFILVDDKAKLQLLSESKAQGAQLIAGAPLAVIVTVDKEASETWVEDASVACTMLMLQAEDMGLGSCWVEIMNRSREDGTMAEDIIREAFGIPEQYGVLAVVAVGYKAQERKPQNEDKLLWEKVHVNKW